ncbi:cyclase [Amycolatopsis aidingensis]|uniref:cyclase n=1 Tax=Amycolatopsis aidingensis TaxID=2842453 RepID=UPI001C0CB9AE|nr:cyclase [Amycolatopsis aidingensis]
MKATLQRRTARALVCASFALVPIAALATPATAESFDITFDCRADAPIVGPQQVSLSQATEVTAPATVAPGGELDVVVDPAPNTVPAEVSGYTVKEVKDFALEIPIPANSTYVDAVLSGGSGIGDTPPVIEVADGVATVSFPGPIAGGAEFELPTVTATLAAGESGTIETRLGGTSYDDPGLTFTAVATVGFIDIEAPTVCFPNPSPTLSTTTIS